MAATRNTLTAGTRQVTQATFTSASRTNDTKRSSKDMPCKSKPIQNFKNLNKKLEPRINHSELRWLLKSINYSTSFDIRRQLEAGIFHEFLPI